MSVRGYVLTLGAGFSVWFWVEFVKTLQELCELACAVGKYGW